MPVLAVLHQILKILGESMDSYNSLSFLNCEKYDLHLSEGFFLRNFVDVVTYCLHTTPGLWNKAFYSKKEINPYM